MATTLGRGDSYPLENYKKGTKVWLRDPEHVWIKAELLEDVTFSSRSIKLRKEIDDEVIEEKVVPDALPFLANPDILIGKDDLTSLSYLHEPAVLHNLRYRFEEKESIYTYCGIVLVAINPYADCSQIYSDDVISIYGNAGAQGKSELDPHIYAISAEAYYDMREYEKNQSIIVSGESGAGKTISAKFVMKYLASVAGSRKSRSDGSASIESRVLASNPIMESIGNAKTIRNDNSSRFGKFIQINFAEDYTISGAEMKTYLLEKSRVVFQSRNERNYHVFYQICAAKKHSLLSGLDLQDADNYYYTSQGQDPFIDGVDDKKDFDELVSSFDLLKIDIERQKEIFRILAGILILGNVNFEGGNADDSMVEKSSNSWITKLCADSVFNVDASSLKTWLTAREIKAGTETVRKTLNVQDACANRDALAKMIYACLFNWIVEKVNENLDQHNTRSRRSQAMSRFIGVLDIYGFETFEINSFEQFCINYANEKLQQQFNQHVFKLEQQEYEREEISWVRIEFYDNQPCIDLIEARPGIIDYLDEQCKMGRGSDADWLSQMSNCPKLKKAPHLQMPKIRDPSFVVKHFAADVSYKIDGFLEKNKDTVNEQLLGVFGRTKFGFLKEIIKDVLASSSTGAKRKKTVACQFRDSLSELITVLSSTRPHYVRCIKPNDEKERFYFEPKRAIQQLRACGVLETVRISAAGYPSRWDYKEFGSRYRVLYPEGKALWKNKPKDFAKLSCEKWLEKDKFALGKTKMFFRVGQVARLEKIRQDVLSTSALKIQTTWRGFVARRKYKKMMESIRIIQASTKAFLAFRRIKYMQMERAAICIQSRFRGFVERKKYEQIRNAIISIQAAFKAREVRRRVLKEKYEKSAVTIQRYFRGYLVRREQIKRIRKIIKVQSYVRRFLAKRKLKKLKAERTTVLFWENKHQSLEKKIIEMQGKLDSVVSERNVLSEKCTSFDLMKAELGKLMIEREELIKIKGIKLSQDVKIADLEEKLNFEVEVKSNLEKELMDLTTANQGLNKKIEKLEEEELKELEKLKSVVDDLDSKNRNMESQLLMEKEKVKRAESEKDEMRKQLLENANLLVSDFTRGGDRASTRSASSDGSGTISSAETNLILKQQSEISELRNRQRNNERKIETLTNELIFLKNDTAARMITSLSSQERSRIQEMEMEVAKLRRDMVNITQAHSNEDVKEYIENMNENLDNLRHENSELRSMMSYIYERKTLNLSPAPETDSAYVSTTTSDDGSVSSGSPKAMEYLDDQLEKDRLVRKLNNENRYLVERLNSKDNQIAELEAHIAQLKVVNNDENGTSASGIQAKVFCDNMLLQQKANRQSDELSELRAQLRGYAGLDNPNTSTNPDGNSTIHLTSLHRNPLVHNGILQIFNVPEFTRILIYDLKPRVARQLTSCLPAYLMLAGFRYYDRENDEIAITGLFGSAHTLLKEMANSADSDILALWLVNSWRLLNLLRQYSGEESAEWSEQNTEKQNSQKITSFNLEPIRHQLQLRIQVFYEAFMKKTIDTEVLSKKILAAVLQHDSSQCLSSSGMAHSGLTRQPSKDTSQHALDDLLSFLSMIYEKLKTYGADRVLLGQTFWQITYWICSRAMNNLVYRKDLCRFEKAIQIKHNVSEVQNWLFKHGFGELRPVLEPLVQACHLLQSRKDEANIDTLCGEMTSLLLPKQVVNILIRYTPTEGFEEDAISKEFIDKVEVKLVQRLLDEGKDVQTLKDRVIVPGSFLEPFNVNPFVYSEFPLENLTLPTCLHLREVCRLA